MINYLAFCEQELQLVEAHCKLDLDLLERICTRILGNSRRNALACLAIAHDWAENENYTFARRSEDEYVDERIDLLAEDGLAYVDDFDGLLGHLVTNRRQFPATWAFLASPKVEWAMAMAS